MSALRTSGKIYFPHCGFIFFRYGLPMSFASELSEIPATTIISALGCPRSTAYEWKDGRRSPPEWLQSHLLAIIRKRHNKTSLATMTRPESGRKGGKKSSE
jgi:hypothetical protein